MPLPELLAPAGSFDAALAAFRYGADAVYLGLPRFSARADADNLTPARLRVLLAHARSFSPPKKIYVTLNTLLQDAELPGAAEALAELADLAPDGVIVQDLGVARLIRDHFPALPLHASTQLAAHSLAGVLALRDLGFTRVVLARELTLPETAAIARHSGVEIETFIHGALCYSVSGLCLFSSHATGRSGNRGRCAYCCREPFSPAPPARHPFSMRDLALAPLLPALAAAGVRSLKIEGRMKSPLYVACVTDYYRRKLDRTLSPADEAALVQDLQTVFSRPWTTLYAAPPPSPPPSLFTPHAPGHRGALIGEASAVIRDRTGTLWLRFTTRRALEKHDGLQVEPRDGAPPFGFPVHLLRRASDPRPLISVPPGTPVEIALPPDGAPAIPPGTPVFCSASQAVRRRYEIPTLRESELPLGRPVAFRVTLRPDGIHASAAVAEGPPLSAAAFTPHPLAPSRQPGQTPAAVRKAFERLGDTEWRFHSLTLDDPGSLYAPPSKLNEARRAVLSALSAGRMSNIQHSISNAQVDSAPPPLDIGHSVLDIGYSLKLRIGTPPFALDGIDTLVLAIGHTPIDLLEKHLADWSAHFPASRITLALPLLTRDRPATGSAGVPPAPADRQSGARAPSPAPAPAPPCTGGADGLVRDLPSETSALRATLRRLADSGWTRFECADLAGHRLLSELRLAPLSADWSLYALNRAALAELARLGIQTAVLSPENSRDNLRALCSAPPPPAAEVIAYQHTPLFISETPPAIPSSSIERTSPRARPRAFTVLSLDNRWITISDAPFCIAHRLPETGASRFRIDLSWSPAPACTAATLSAVLAAARSGRPLPGTHTANFDRGFT